jgi:hypothetical protein
MAALPPRKPGPWRRSRRPDDGAFRPRDAATWRRLIRLARQAARNPERFGVDLGAAASAAVRAVMPPGHRLRDSVFLQLALKGRVFPTTPAAMRAALAAELERLAGACAEILDAPNPRPPRVRADIHDGED